MTMRRGGRAVAERAEMVRILSAEPVLCLDCGSARYRVETDGQRCTVALYHLRECPVRRSAWSARAADDYLRAVLIIGGMHLSDYLDVAGAHR